MDNQIKREILFNQEAVSKIASGAKKLAKAVSATYGSNGKNVLVSRIGLLPFITKDGVTVAQNTNLPDPLENIGAQIIKDAASKTAIIAGDGTTTATILAEAFLSKGIEILNNGNIHPIALKRGIDIHVSSIIEELKNKSVHVEDDLDKLKHIASISANGDEEIGTLISDTFKKIGKDGVVHIEESNTTSTSVDITNGIKFKGGFISPYFINNEAKMTCELENALVFVTDEKLTTIKDVVPILNCTDQGKRPLVIIADDVQGEALATIVYNTKQGKINAVCIKSSFLAHFRNNALKDITVATGATIMSDQLGERIDERLTQEKFGKVAKIVVSETETNIIPHEDLKGQILAYSEELKVQLNEKKNTIEEDDLAGRIANLNSNVAVIKVGAPTFLEMNEKRDRIDDAVRATKSALEEGYVPGGGLALLSALHTSKEAKDPIAFNLVKEVLYQPFKRLCENAGLDFDTCLSMVADTGFSKGINVSTGETCDLIAEGVIDPTKVVRVALENAASIASTLLTTDCLVAEY